MSGVAALLSPLVFLKTDVSLFPELPPVGAMLRLVQFSVADALRDGAATLKIAKRLLVEIDEIEIEELRVLQASIAIPKILSAEYANIPASLQLEWALRLRTVMRKISEFENEEIREHFATLARDLNSRFDQGVDLSDFLFAVVSNRIRNSEDMLAMVEALDALGPDDRNTFIDGAASTLGHSPGSFVHNGWAGEQLEDHDMSPVLRRFERMTVVARGWRRPDVLSEVFCARSVILDESSGDRVSAVALMDTAIAELGALPLLIRQKAKVLGHSGDHETAARLLISVEDVVGVDQPFDRALALRDGAVSAARAELLDDALRLFRKAQAAIARDNTHPALEVGFRIEIAIVLWTMADRKASLLEIADALDTAAGLDSTSSRQNERAHQLLRLAVGLFWNDLDPYSSRPKPIDAIGRATALAGDDPLLGIDLAALPDVWRMLALCEIGTGIEAGIEAKSNARQAGPGLFAIEVLIARARYTLALSKGDLESAFQLGVRALSASKATIELRASGRTRAAIAELEGKSVVTLRAEGWGELVDTILLDALLWCVLRGENGASASELVRAAYESAWGQDRAAEEILAAAAGTKSIAPVVSAGLRLASYFAPASDLRGKPASRLERDLLLVCDTAQSGARAVLEPLVIEELANGWSRVIEEETFALHMPLVYGPDIVAATKEMRSSGLRGAARLILAAAPASRYPLSKQWLKLLQTIIEERQSIDRAA
jgi:tetratricopeptide (TPR) repeat protein